MPKKIETRQSTIQAAIEDFSKNNDSTPMISGIAQKTRVAEAAVHQYSKNKEDLFFSILAEKTFGEVVVYGIESLLVRRRYLNTFLF